MELYEKIRFMRMFKGWSQEETAEKLGMAVSGYAKIERGETDMSVSRLTQIANLFGIELSNLIGLNEKNVFNIMASCNEHSLLLNVNVSTPESEFKIQFEKAQLVIERQTNEIAYLKEIIELMKRANPI
jgi:transcriptional regulator with XRE-family HTH domain